jgi:hypothetical protein
VKETPCLILPTELPRTEMCSRRSMSGILHCPLHKAATPNEQPEGG